MKLGLVQLDIQPGEFGANRRAAEQCLRQAADEKCDVVILPEAFTTGFPITTAVLTMLEQDDTLSFLSRLAHELNINIIAGLVCKHPKEAKGRNSSVVFDRNGGVLASYSKMYLFSVIREADLIEEGSSVARFEIDGIASSLCICYDLRFPEAFRNVASSISCFFVLSNWLTKRIDHWTTLLKARAIENQCFVVGVNRTGIDGNGIHYPGVSMVIDPWGNEVCRVGSEAGLFTCIIEPERVSEIRAKFSFLNDIKRVMVNNRDHFVLATPSQSPFRWRWRNASGTSGDQSRLFKALEQENLMLSKRISDLSFENEVLKKIMHEKFVNQERSAGRKLRSGNR